MQKPTLHLLAIGFFFFNGCDKRSDMSLVTVSRCEEKLGKLVAVADKIEFRDGRLLITRPAVSDSQRSDINGKSLLFSRLAIVDVDVSMLVATPYVPPFESVVDVDIPSGHVFVVDVDTRGEFSEPRTESLKSIEVLPP